MSEVANKRIAVTENIYNRIIKNAHHGQTVCGILTEILDDYDRLKMLDLPKPKAILSVSDISNLADTHDYLQDRGIPVRKASIEDVLNK